MNEIRRRISYKSLNSPTEPGAYRTSDGGEIYLGETEIRDGMEYGDKLIFDCVDGRGISDRFPSWNVVGYILL